jgi:hypothetical protein
MFIFLDYKKNIVYILSPKCGTQTIATSLDGNLFPKYSIEEETNCLQSDNFKKIIIYKKNILSRFLSGFHEDLFNNTCYDDIDITFDNYLIFLKQTFINKDKCTNTLIDDKGVVAPIWFGNCSNVSLPITDSSGEFVSHIISQKTSIKRFIDNILGNNVEICELHELNKLIGNIHENKKIKIRFNNIGSQTLSFIKKNRIIIDDIDLNDEQKNIINSIYNEDIEFIKDLEEKYQSIKKNDNNSNENETNEEEKNE